MDFLLFIEKILFLFFVFRKIVSTFAIAKRLSAPFGTLDEWLSQRSAKPCTAVRIRQVPQKVPDFFIRDFFVLNKL